MALKLLSTLRRSPETKSRMESACAGLRTVLLAAKEASGNAGVPGLPVGLGGLLLVLDVIRKTTQNIEDIEALAGHIESLTRILSHATETEARTEVVDDRLNGLVSILAQVSEEIKMLGSRNFIKRALTSEQDAQWLQNQIRSVSWAIESFTVETSLSLEFAIGEHIRFAKDSTRTTLLAVQATHAVVQDLSMKMDANVVGEGRPAHASKAAFNSKEREACTDATRENILSDIFKWIHHDSMLPKSNLPSATHGVDYDRPIFWLNGSAGTGKTTIAYTVAKRCWDSHPNLLGASFFCSRDDVECSDLGRIFTTLSYQLGIFNPLFAAEVSKILNANPEIGYASVHYQLQELIIKPLALVRDSFQRCIIVVDALDECKDSATISTILSGLSSHVVDLFPLQFMVTSRPEAQITLGFAVPAMRPHTQHLALHQVELPVVQRDIQTYLTSRLSTTKIMYNISPLWPPPDCVHTLAQLSSGLFIFAATSVKFIEDPFYSNPREQLDLLLRTPRVVGKSSPFDRLDQLYTQVLSLAYPEISHRQLRVLKTVLGSILYIRDPLSPLCLDNLLGLEVGRVRETLLRLHSVVIVPDDNDDDTLCIRLLHPSFYDFLTDATRCIPNLTMKLEEQNTLLALSCLRSMQPLVRDLCRIGHSSLLNTEIIDLPARIGACIPGHIQYSCRHWAFHVSRALLTATLLEDLNNFCEEHLLHWIEVCSLLGELREALVSLSDLISVLMSRGQVDQRTLTLLGDCMHLIREFFPVISISALQVYHSALPFAPDGALLVGNHQGEMDLPVKTYNAADETWSLCDIVIDGQAAAFQSVCFSPDGTRILSGSRDGYVRLWDASTGVHLQTLKGQSSSITSVAFSANGAWIVAGSRDAYVYLWDGDGNCIRTLKGHFDSVECVAFSPAKPCIASGSEDMTIRLWDSTGVAHIATLKGHSGAVLSVAFSPSGTRIASGSADHTIRLWDASTFMHLRILRRYPEWVTSLAFSPDGTHIAAGCSDQNVWICDAWTGTSIRTLKGHAGRVTSVSFSPDGQHIISGSMDHTARLWDTASGSSILLLDKHSEWVMSVAFSEDGTRVVSGSEDRTIRVWDARRTARIETAGDTASHVAFSSDGMILATSDVQGPARPGSPGLGPA
ncbi:hypothetical protein C8R43DRAFT_210760 [Mycena crocata]|nr:hypothetical protein C8R43DRAFT_210760 [Mycena crocata]